MTRIGFIVLAATIPLFASDTLVMRDGSRHLGTFVSATNRMVTFEENGARRQYDLGQVDSVQFDPSMAFRTNSNRDTYADRGARDVAGRTIPSGTELAVRTNEEIQ